tara:strand:+ start:3855 stop:3986 length:132 start_codon:yes stop_codon:yes gene_type:complete
MCPYEKMHTGKSKKIRNEIIEQLQDWEKQEIKKHSNLKLDFDI